MCVDLIDIYHFLGNLDLNLGFRNIDLVIPDLCDLDLGLRDLCDLDLALQDPDLDLLYGDLDLLHGDLVLLEIFSLSNG